MLLLDEDVSIETEARSFFVLFASEGNDLFNQLPDIMGNLHKMDMPESKFRTISEFLFEQLQAKDKQIELIVEKYCLKFTEDDPSVWSQVNYINIWNVCYKYIDCTDNVSNDAK